MGQQGRYPAQFGDQVSLCIVAAYKQLHFKRFVVKYPSIPVWSVMSYFAHYILVFGAMPQLPLTPAGVRLQGRQTLQVLLCRNWTSAGVRALFLLYFYSLPCQGAGKL